MEISEKTILAEITQLPNGEIQTRTTTVVCRGENIISSSDHYENYLPGSDLTGVDPKVATVARATWTPESIGAVTAEVQAAMDEQKVAQDKLLEEQAMAVAMVEEQKVLQATLEEEKAKVAALIAEKTALETILAAPIEEVTE